MAQNLIHEDVVLATSIDIATCVQDLGIPNWVARLQARAFAAKFDRQVDEGVTPQPSSPLAAHIIRLTSTQEREDIARSFRRILDGGPQLSISVLTNRIEECRNVIDDITLRLHSPRPVAAQGMARLRMILSNGSGPLYFQASTGLAAELRGALAAL